jgi:hypothetical protein
VLHWLTFQTQAVSAAKIPDHMRCVIDVLRYPSRAVKLFFGCFKNG